MLKLTLDRMDHSFIPGYGMNNAMAGKSISDLTLCVMCCEKKRPTHHRRRRDLKKKEFCRRSCAGSLGEVKTHKST